MDLFGFIKQCLKEKDFDGVYYPGTCSCDIDDLFPCGEFSTVCRPGVKMPCDCELGCDHHIGEKEGGDAL